MRPAHWLTMPPGPRVLDVTSKPFVDVSCSHAVPVERGCNSRAADFEA